MQVSVALCTYNGESFVEEQLDSILSQTRKPDEIIICDDNSVDATPDIASRYEEEFPNIINLYINDENLGVRKNFEKCISLCSGDAIVISDQDDVWKQDKVEKQVDILEDEGVSMTYHNSTITNESLEPLGDFWAQFPHKPASVSTNNELFNILLTDNFIRGATLMFESRLVDKFTPIPDQWNYDYYIVLIASIIGDFYEMDEELSLYRQHEGQDIGIPDSDPNSIKHTIDKFHHYLQMGKADYENVLELNKERWGVLMERLSTLNDENYELEKTHVIGEIKDRYEYHKNRHMIYTSDTRSQLRYFRQNIQKNWYSFENGLLTAGRDLMEIIH